MLVQQLKAQLVWPPIAVGLSDASGVIEWALTLFSHFIFSNTGVCGCRRCSDAKRTDGWRGINQHSLPFCVIRV
jgi:hypothetical protein